jgi:hypothetical protein
MGNVEKIGGDKTYIKTTLEERRYNPAKRERDLWHNVNVKLAIKCGK